MAGHHWSKSVFEPKIAMLCADQGQKQVGAKPSKGKHHMSTNPPNVELINLSLRAHDGSDGSGIESGFLIGFPTFHLNARVSLSNLLAGIEEHGGKYHTWATKYTARGSNTQQEIETTGSISSHLLMAIRLSVRVLCQCSSAIQRAKVWKRIQSHPCTMPIIGASSSKTCAALSLVLGTLSDPCNDRRNSARSKVAPSQNGFVANSSVKCNAFCCQNAPDFAKHPA